MGTIEVFALLTLSVAYKCDAALGNAWGNAFPSTSRILNVTIVGGPQFLCFVFGSRPFPKITWALEDRIIPQSRYSVLYSKTDLIAVSVLNLNPSERNSLEYISCSATNSEYPGEEVSQSKFLNFVKKKPAVTTTMTTTTLKPVSSKAIIITKDEYVHCVVTGYGIAPIIKWIIGRTQISKEKYKTVYDESTLTSTSHLDMKVSDQGTPVELICFAQSNIPPLWMWKSINVTLADRLLD